MASKFLHEAQRGASRGSIDMPLALLAGFAVGFVAFVMPGDLLSQAVALSGLPSVLPAAAPPLGTKAHALLAAATATATVAAVFLILRVLGGKAAPAPIEHELDEPDREPPRLRRSDVHPDAPARRPILAARELGEPTPASALTPAPAPSPAPFWRPEDFPPEPEAQEDEPEAEVEDEELELGGPGIEMIEPPAVPIESSEPIAQTPPAAEPADQADIAALIARLERGLQRRLQDRSNHEQDMAVADQEAPVPIVAENDRGDDRLRSAIENLQKMAARAR